MKPQAPEILWEGLSPFLALLGGAVIVLMLGLLRSRAVRHAIVPALSFAAFGAAVGLGVWQWDTEADLISGALRLDRLTLMTTFIVGVAGMSTVVLSWRALAPREAAHGEFHALLLTSAAGMVVLAAAQNLVTVFLGLELLSIPLYVLCATEMRRASSLESGLKYLIVGSAGSAILLYGAAFVYGATGDTDFAGIASALGDGEVATDPLLLTGVALLVVGLAFKSSIAPFHQWTPDVYEGAPTAVTAFMATATKAASFAIFLRLFDVALIEAELDWGPALATLAAITIVVGNVGALGQRSLKRLLAWSSIAQAGYILAGVVVASQLGVAATVFYLCGYLVMNVAAFAVIIARERETVHGDDLEALRGLAAERPVLAWPLTVAMLGLAGIPLTVGFIGKFFLIDAAVAGGYTWLGIAIVVGSMISLAYYLRVVATMWARPEPASGVVPAVPAMAGADPAADPRPAPPEVVGLAVVAGVATIALGVAPQWLFELAEQAGGSFPGIF